jgi:hypothetical protein
MLLGDIMAYLDVFSVLFLLGVLSRVATIVFVLKQAAARARELMEHAYGQVQRLDFRHRRAGGGQHGRRSERQTGSKDDTHAATGGLVWA